MKCDIINSGTPKSHLLMSEFLNIKQRQLLHVQTCVLINRMTYSSLHNKNGVAFLTEQNDSFENQYITLRKKENRVISDKVLKRLPHTDINNPHHSEWQLRNKSTERFISYYKSKTHLKKVLDLGCGNGWFTNCLAQANPNCEVLGLDINTVELFQAASVFNSSNLKFAYGDIFSLEAKFDQEFDLITMNGCVQYFQSMKNLIELLQKLLKPKGEIHFIDSPFYQDHEVQAAKERTKLYYKKIGHPQMAAHYFHHSISELGNHQTLFNPKRSKLSKLIFGKDSPFPWIKITKTKTP